MNARRLTYLAIIAILVLAAALRFYRIDAQSLWNDEGNSARIAERSTALIVEGAAGDIHPPLYYLTLQAWRGVFGSSEAALRGLSAVFGLITVLFTYRLGRRLFEARVGLVAAFLAAVNPFQVYYSQEARMYMMLAAIGLVATYLLIRLIDYWSLRPRIHIPHRRYVVLYVVAMAAGLYTHYAFPFIFVAHFAIVLAWSLYRPERTLSRIGSWLSLAFVAALAFLPWLPTALRQISGWPSQAASADAGVALLDAYHYYLLGESFPADASAVALIVAGFFLAMSLWTPDAFDEPEPDWDTTAPRALRAGSVAIYLLLPFALIFLLGLFKDAYMKFLMVGSPAFCLLLARGIDNGWQIARGAMQMPPELRGPQPWAFGWLAVVVVLAAFVLAPTVSSLGNLYFDPAYARDDYRGIARTIESGWRDSDAVVLHAANQWEVFTYYFDDGPQVYPIVRQRPLDPKAAEGELRGILASHKRLWVVYWAETEPDPAHWVETWLDANAYKATEQPFGDVRLVRYAVPIDVANVPANPLRVRLGDRIWLDGYSLATPSVPPGDIVQVTLFWHAEQVIDQRYKVFVHILDVDGAIVAQTDREPGGDRVPTTIWAPDESIVDRYGVAVPADTAPGTYQMSIGMYGFDGTRLPIAIDGVDGGDALNLAEVAVAP